MSHSLRTVGCVVAVALAFATPSALADVLAYEEASLSAGDPAPWDQLGQSVSISGDTLVAGAPWGDDAGADSGAAYVFVRVGNGWVQQAKLVAADAHADDRFGSAVAIDGDRIVVGSPFDDDAGLSSGSAYVFVRSGSSWSQQAKLTASDAAAADAFGTSVAIHLTSVAVGAVGNADSGPYTGSAYVFVHLGGSSWGEQAKLLSTSTTSSAYFGTSIDIDVNRLVVGATGSGRGAYVFDRIAANWNFLTRLTDPTGAPPDRFASSVSVRGDRVAVGAPLVDQNGTDSGAVLVFLKTGTMWSLETRLLAGESFGRLGTSVGLADDLLAAGAPSDYDFGPAPKGALYLFQRVAGAWSQTARVVPLDVDEFDEFAATVAFDGSSIAAGAPRGDDGGVNAGVVRAYGLVAAPRAYCFGDGSGTPCPCLNDVPGGGGCGNSSGSGAVLTLFGLPSLSDDLFTFRCEHLLTNQPALLFSGVNAVNGGNGTIFGDGLRCAGGATVRLGVRLPGPDQSATWGPGLAAIGGWAPGDLRRFQAWYRDPVGTCGLGFNLSNGMEATFIP